MKTGMTLANFSRIGKVPSENEKWMSLTRGFEKTEHESLSIMVGILSEPTDLEVLISFISDSSSLWFTEVRKNEFTIKTFRDSLWAFLVGTILLSMPLAIVEKTC